MAACGIQIAVNGSVTDVDVENDSANWKTKAGNVRITQGGGSWWRTSRPAVLSIDLDVPIEHMWAIRSVTIALTLDVSTLSSLPAGTFAGPPPGKVLFHGQVWSTRSDTARGLVRVDAVEDLQNLLSRRARLAAANNSGIRGLLTAIETAHSLSTWGSLQFPSAADYMNLDRPAQKGASNGEWIRKALAGSGINLVAQWTGPVTNPYLQWRPDFFESYYSASVDTTYQWTWNAGYPWELDYPDVGRVWNDAAARVNIDGEDSAGNEYYGWARLDDATQRNKLGNREINISTWIDNTTDLQRQARRLLAYVGEPGYTKMNQIMLPVEHYYQVMDTKGAPDPEIEILTAAGLYPGDLITKRDPWGNTNTDYGNWPAHCPIGSQREGNLQELWEPIIEDDAAGGPAYTQIVKSVTREYDPAGGWTMTYGVEPWEGTALDAGDISSYGSGTY